MLLHFVFLFVGQVLHVLMRTFESVRSDPDAGLGVIVWYGAEKYRTIMLVIFMAVIAFTDSAASMLAAAGITADASGMAILLIAAGYNVDSISKKVFALGAPKKP
jgi:hypothetical protein